MKRSAVKKRTPQNKNKNTLIFVLLLISVVTAVSALLYLQNNQQNREHTNAQASGSGWLSGAACEGVPDGSFASWRGSPVTIAGTWNDGSLDAQLNQKTLGAQEYGDWDQSLDVSIGGIMSGTWADAANGAYDTNLHQALAAIDANWGNKKTIFIRFGHEFNGDWYTKWLVNADNNEDYKKAFARFSQMVHDDLVVAKGRDAKVVWPPNSDDHNGIKATDSWPGDQYVDVVGVDYYDWDEASNQSKWDEVFNKTGTYGGPAGIGAWQAFAREHGKPLSLPEWGTTGSGPYDDPFFIQKMNEFFRANAGTGPGQVWYEIYFNCKGYDHGNGENFLIYLENESKVPQSAAMYKSLTWGDGGISGTNPSTSQPVASPTQQLITPSYGCVGGVNCVPSTSPNPSDNPPVGVSTNPSEDPSINPETTLSVSQVPGQDGGSGRNGGNGGRGRGGFFGMIIQFFLQLIAFLLGLIGVRS